MPLYLLGYYSFSALFFTEYYPRKLSFIPEAIYSILPPPRPIEEGGQNPNYFPSLIVVLLPISLAQWILTEPRQLSKWLKLLSMISTLISGFVLLVLQSRASLLATVTGLFIFLTLLAFRHNTKLLFILVSFIICISLFLFVFTYTELAQPIIEALGNPFGYTFIERTRYWLYGYLMLNDLPFTGAGVGATSDAVQLLYPKLNTEQYSYLHNLFLEIAADIGIMGLISWLGLLITASFSAWCAYRSSYSLLKPLGAALLAVQASILAHQVLEGNAWTDRRLSSLVWSLWGISIAIGFRAQLLKGKKSPHHTNST